jgi:hypothetical protein
MMVVQGIAVSLLQFMFVVMYSIIAYVCSKCRPLWAFEDITSKVHRIKSAENLELLLKYFVRIYKESLPSVHIQQRWAQEAIHLALSCSSRHYAGRSFQVRLYTVGFSKLVCSSFAKRLTHPSLWGSN